MWFSKNSGVHDLPVELRDYLSAQDRVPEAVGLVDGGWVVVSTSRLLIFTDTQLAEMQEFPWSQICQSRWDEDTQTLEFAFYNDSTPLCFRPSHPPSVHFMDIIREGIAAYQVFSSSVDLPSGQKKTCTVIRDEDRNFRFYPDPQTQTNPLDQQFLSELWGRWQVALGVE